MAIRSTSTRSVSARGMSARWVPYFVFGLFIVLGSVLTWVFGLSPLLEHRQHATWTPMPCTIVSSTVERSTDSDGDDTYRFAVTFRYIADDQERTSHNFRAGGTIYSSGRAAKEDLVAQYPVGSSQTCYVNPADPDQAVLSRELDSNMWFGLLPVIFAVIGGLGLVLSAARQRDGPRGPRELWAYYGGRAQQARQLLPQRSRLNSALIVSIFTIVWCAMLALIASIALPAISEGDAARWIFIAFLAPFALVGIVMIVVSVRTILAIGNPVYTLSVNPPQPTVAQGMRLSWQAGGSTHNIRRLTIKLVCSQLSYSYDSENTRSLNSAERFSITVAEVTQPSQIAMGSAEVQVPAEAPPSQTMHDGGGILWHIELRGDIPNWPDVVASYPITINHLGALTSA